MYTLYKFHFLNGISEINQLFDDILIIWPAPVYIYLLFIFWKNKTFTSCCPYLKKFLFHLVLHQIRSEASLPAGEVISGDGEGNLRGVQRFFQPPPGGRQQVCLRDQPLDELLQLGSPAVDVLQPIAQVFGARGLRA